MAPKGAVKKTARPGKSTGFNADERAAIRESEQIPVGGVILTRARRVWAVTLAMQDLLAEQERHMRRASRCRIEADELEEKALEAGEEVDDDRIDELLAQAREQQNFANEMTFKLIAALTRTEDGAEPPLEHLKANLDVEDAAELTKLLTGTDEPEANPTPMSGSPDTSSS